MINPFFIYKNRKVLVVLYLLFSVGLSAQNTITTSSLLKEMTDRDMIACYPYPYYESKQFSSYQRDSKGVDLPGWYANKDYNQFVREENHNDRREFVLFDTKGPGAVVRFWSTVADYKGEGILRIYLDGNKEPEIEGEIFSLLGKNILAGYPLSASVSEKAKEQHRGYNLYFPITYSSACKITYESEAIYHGEILYYNIGYRTYEKDAKIQSFRRSDMLAYAEQIKETNKILSDYKRMIPENSKVNHYETTILKSQDRLTAKIKGKLAIRKIAVKFSGGNYEQALRSTVLKIGFDGKETVWVPLGDFFGTGYQLSPYKTWYTEVTPDSTLSCYWVMPFQENCEISIENQSNNDVRFLSIDVTTSPWKWTDKSMYFGAGWYELYNLNTRKNRDFFDLNFVNLRGQGVLVGTGITVFDPVGIWWGEGDEKIYVDGEAFPSTFGTGTEDFFGYAWCRLETFEHPFIAQSRGDGNNSTGMTSNVRFRSLDGIPFRNQLQFDMEMWHHVETRVNYAPVSYYYMKEGGHSNLKPQPDAVKEKVILQPQDMISDHVGRDGYVEMELMESSTLSGNISSQSILNIFSFNRQAWWKDADIGSKAEFVFNSKYEGNYPLEIRLTKADDYSRIRISFNRKVCLECFDAYNDKIDIQRIDLGTQFLKKGKNMLTVEILGKNPLAKGKKQMCGLDCITFDINK